MKTLKFNITINAPRERVWKVLWEDDSYRKWTSVFSAGSRADTDWKKGSKVYFLGANGEGMISTIAEIQPFEYMSFRHIGTLMKGVEDYDSEESRKWAGAMENYSLKETGGNTELTVELDTVTDFQEYFSKTFPEALKKVKELSENVSVEN
jgi:hypothetical protein